MARAWNRSAIYKETTLAPLCVPLPRLPVPDVPPPPTPGAAVDLPPLGWAPPAIVVPGPDPLFPATRGDISNITSKCFLCDVSPNLIHTHILGNNINMLLNTYNVPGPHGGPVAHRRSTFSVFIGVRE